MAAHNTFGSAAEQRAAALLEQRGWEILDRNWRWQHKEIDLVVRRARTVAFVEVRARRSAACGHPLATLGGRKRRDLAAAAAVWIARHGRPREEYRFDAVTVLDPSGTAGPASRIEHLEGAWLL